MRLLQSFQNIFFVEKVPIFYYRIIDCFSNQNFLFPFTRFLPHLKNWKNVRNKGLVTENLFNYIYFFSNS